MITYNLKLSNRGVYMRACGILMPIFSLSSKYGIGTLGKEAYDFVDFLAKAGQTYWQILPLNPTNYGDSPYQSFSSFAGNPYFIDIVELIKEGLITESQADSFDFGDDDESIDYGKLYENRLKLLKLSFNNFKPDRNFIKFAHENSFWLDDYALFMALKNAHNDKPWQTWDKSLKFRDNEALKKARIKYSKDIEFYKYIQYKFDEQWIKLKKYANENGIFIIGDVPIYVALDSADVWSDPKQFLLDEDLIPTVVAGCPPDAFSTEGQLWGNPIYNWTLMEKDGYRWWKKYLGNALKRYNVIRIDHFRGFESYYTIPYGDQNAKGGKWVKGPDIKLFNAFKSEFGENLPIIAEDLGFLTPEVYKMLDTAGFPGMKVLQFAFDPSLDSDYLPHKFDKNCVVYTGTHDNDTILGWLTSADENEVKIAEQYLNCNTKDGFNWAMIRAALMSVADTCILMMADIIGLDSKARINVPSTVGGNWKWRIKGECINDWLADILLKQTEIYGRLPKKSKIFGEKRCSRNKSENIDK